MREGINTLSRWCECGVRVVSVTQQIDLSGTVGHLVAGVLFAVAQIELEHVRERQAAGIALAKQRGVYKGRKRGATKAKPERARELRGKGMTLPEIAACCLQRWPAASAAGGGLSVARRNTGGGRGGAGGVPREK